MGTASRTPLAHIRLVMLVNDVSLRNLIPGRAREGLRLLPVEAGERASRRSPSRPTSSATRGATARCTCRSLSHLNGELFGRPDAGVDMTFDFGTLIAHVAKTRDLVAGTHRRDRAPCRTRRTAVPAGPRPRAASATRASPSSAPSRRSSRARRDAVPALRRPRAHRDARRAGPLDLRRDRPGRARPGLSSALLGGRRPCPRRGRGPPFMRASPRPRVSSRADALDAAFLRFVASRLEGARSALPTMRPACNASKARPPESAG